MKGTLPSLDCSLCPMHADVRDSDDVAQRKDGGSQRDSCRVGTVRVVDPWRDSALYCIASWRYPCRRGFNQGRRRPCCSPNRCASFGQRTRILLLRAVAYCASPLSYFFSFFLFPSFSFFSFPFLSILFRYFPFAHSNMPVVLLPCFHLTMVLAGGWFYLLSRCRG